jgi:CysZ protein
MNDNPVSGFNYLLRGASLLTAPSLRLFVLLPLMINILVFSIALYFTFSQISVWIEQIMSWMWSWLDFLRWIIWPMVTGLVVVFIMHTFSMVANIIAAPFNGLLAEKTEELLTGKPVAGAEGFLGALKDTPRVIVKELAKLGYYLVRAIPIAILALILLFVFPPAATALWFLFGAWMLALEYCDYPMDNHQHSLTDVKTHIGNKRWTSLAFGSATMLGTMIPIVNFIVMPAAVCGATIYWVEALKKAE